MPGGKTSGFSVGVNRKQQKSDLQQPIFIGVSGRFDNLLNIYYLRCVPVDPSNLETSYGKAL